MHIIIIGAGDLGYPLAKSLEKKHDVFVVDPDPLLADRFADLDVEFVIGRGTNPDVIQNAGADKCDLLIAATRYDEVNIVACSLGSQLGSSRTICFVTKEDFLHAPGGPNYLRQHFGIDQVVWPEAQLAAAIERIIMAPGAVDADKFADGRIQLLEFRLDGASSFVNQLVSDLTLPSGIVIAAIKHEKSTLIPKGNSMLSEGDKVVLIGTPQGMEEFRAQGSMIPSDQSSQLVTIIGGGDVGFRLAQQLDSIGNIKLCVIENDSARCEMLAGSLVDALVLNGDGTDIELLEAEDIGHSDVLVSVMDNDESNLLASLLGRQLGVRRLITRVSKPSNHRLFELVGIDVALSAHGAAVTSVVHQIDGGHANLLAVLEVDEGQVRVVELTVPNDFITTPIKTLKLPEESMIATLLHEDTVIVPHGDDRIQSGDHVLVCCTEAALGKVRDLFAQG